MRQIKKVLYILNPNTYIHCDHDAFAITQTFINEEGEEYKKTTTVPTLTIEEIIIFGETIVSSYLLGYCSRHGISLSYISEYGTFYGKLTCDNIGNVLLRKEQYRIAESSEKLDIAKNIVLGKSINQKNLLLYAEKMASETNRKMLEIASRQISNLLGDIKDAETIATLRGIEGSIASIYFSSFDYMIKQTKTGMQFDERSKRPPKNPCNALLSFLYTIMTSNCVAALETFGLEPYLGFLHEILPGRKSLSCDLVEEFRTPFVDRFVLLQINNRQITEKDFIKTDVNIRLKNKSKRELLVAWEKWKNEKVTFHLYDKTVERKVIPYLQAQLLAQYIRGDIPEYPPYIWEEY